MHRQSHSRSKRLRFVFSLSSLATVYGGILAYRLLHYQDDAASDIIKMCFVILLGTLILSFFWWSVVTRKISGPWGGALAAVLTGLCIIPVPTFAGVFKSEFVADHNVISAGLSGLKYSLSTFSAAEALALPLCAAAGYFLAK